MIDDFNLLRPVRRTGARSPADCYNLHHVDIKCAACALTVRTSKLRSKKVAPF